MAAIGVMHQCNELRREKLATHGLLTSKKDLCDCLHRALGRCDNPSRDTHLLADKLKRPALRKVHTSDPKSRNFKLNPHRGAQVHGIQTRIPFGLRCPGVGAMLGSGIEAGFYQLW